jgi:3-hydroxyisobutyrate dehydrogenase-like beta-hydroxyacid dehydrogenase
MGGAIAQRLTEQGFEIVAWDHAEKATQLAAGRGVRIAANPKVIAAEAEMVISIITEDHGVWKVFTGPNGLLEADVQGKLFIEMSTLQPTTGREPAPLVVAKSARLIESPVLGTITSVHEGKLFSLAGGRVEDIDRARVVLDKLTRRRAYGPPRLGLCHEARGQSGARCLYPGVVGIARARNKQGLSLDQMLDVLKEAPTATGWLHSKIPFCSARRPT